MRLNKYIASCSNLSRRGADDAIKLGRITINGNPATLTSDIKDTDIVKLDSRTLSPRNDRTIVLLNKPVGYVCSRKGQGSQTIYDLIPAKYHHLESVGRLDKDSSGLLLLTDDGELANKLTHPSFRKEKVYEVTLDKSLHESDLARLQHGIELDDGTSRFIISPLKAQNSYLVTISEGRNRQIRRTFEYLGLEVQRLHRTKFGNYVLPSNLTKGEFSEVDVL
ncbi:MAG: pseudouridine synthase [Patescibacteria group bacterium]